MTETIQNLTKAFIGESQARNRYTIYSRIAKKEGYEQIADIFVETATQESEHAKWLFRMIQDLKQKETDNTDPITVEAVAPTTYGDTLTNLKAALAGETYEHTEMYPSFAAKADEEGFPEIAARLRAIAKAETHHGGRYAKLISQIENDTVFKKSNKVYWVCRKCGYIEEGETAPEKCPSCGHPQAYFQVQSEVY